MRPGVLAPLWRSAVHENHENTGESPVEAQEIQDKARRTWVCWILNGLGTLGLSSAKNFYWSWVFRFLVACRIFQIDLLKNSNG